MSDELLSALMARDRSVTIPGLKNIGDTTFRLVLTSERAVSIPQPDNTGDNWTLIKELRAAIITEAERLANPLLDLRRAWHPATGDSEWERVAPSLVVGWLLGHVGSLQFMRLLELTAAAIDLNPAEQEQMVALSFVRASPENGVAHLLGGPYADGVQVRYLLNLPGVRASLGSVDAEGELLLYAQGPLRLLNAYREEDRRAFYPSTYRLALPVLSSASLQAMREPLALVSSRLGAGWSRLVSLAQESLPASELTPGRWLRFYSHCVGEMTRLWLEQQLLPPVVSFQADQRAGWFRRQRQTQTEQQPPCGLCFWRDVGAMWELGKSLA